MIGDYRVTELMSDSLLWRLAGVSRVFWQYVLVSGEHIFTLLDLVRCFVESTQKNEVLVDSPKQKATSIQ